MGFLLGMALAIGWSHELDARGVEQRFDVLNRELIQVVKSFNRGDDPLDLDGLSQALERLAESYEHHLASRIDLGSTQTLDLEVDPAYVFGEVPTLPPEKKQGSTWSFEPVVVRVLPKHLYVFGLKFKASRTSRMRSVRLHFRDGSSILHDSWYDLNGGNGVVLDKRRFTDMLTVWRAPDPRRAKPLEAIEILGSAQDRDHRASLEFVFRIPDPESRPSAGAAVRLNRLMSAWAGGIPTAERLNRFQEDVRLLAADLGVPFQAGPLAVGR